MATRAPQFDDTLAAKHIGGSSYERRRPAPQDDPFLQAVLNAPLDTEPLTPEELSALERFRQKKRSRGA